MGAGMVVDEPLRRTRHDGVEPGNVDGNGQGRDGRCWDGQLMMWVSGCNQGITVDLQRGRRWGLGRLFPNPS